MLVGGPHEELSWEEFRRLNGDNKGESGFWVEGVSGLAYTETILVALLLTLWNQRGGPGATPTCYQNALYRRKTYEEDYTVRSTCFLVRNNLLISFFL